jgi:hypothetical protein
MEPNERDKSVPNEIQALLSDERLILRETQRSVTPFGGVAVFIAYLRKIDLAGKVDEHMPVRWRSPNQIDPAATFTSFLIAVLLGAKRFAISSGGSPWAMSSGCLPCFSSCKWSACRGETKATAWTWIPRSLSAMAGRKAC